jgi:hypothetical protein
VVVKGTNAGFFELDSDGLDLYFERKGTNANWFLCVVQREFVKINFCGPSCKNISSDF